MPNQVNATSFITAVNGLGGNVSDIGKFVKGKKKVLRYSVIETKKTVSGKEVIESSREYTFKDINRIAAIVICVTKKMLKIIGVKICKGWDLSNVVDALNEDLADNLAGAVGDVAALLRSLGQKNNRPDIFQRVMPAQSPVPRDQATPDQIPGDIPADSSVKKFLLKWRSKD